MIHSLLGAAVLLTGCGSRPRDETTAQGKPLPSAAVNQAAESTASVFVPADTLSLDSVSEAYPELEANGAGLDSAFKRVIGEEPHMGWSTPGRFITTERHPRVYIWSGAPTIHVATYAGAISSAEHARLAQTTHLACDTKGPLAQYTLAATDSVFDRQRAFYTSVAPPNGTKVGFLPRTLTSAERAAAHTLLAAAEASTYDDTAFAPSGSKVSYSIDAAYDSTGTLLKGALVLYDSLGTILASDVEPPSECDGCGPTTKDEGFRGIYDIRNAFEVPGFPYPILLLDTSTVEGRALSLVTFMAPGDSLANYRIYEYVVECILGGHG